MREVEERKQNLEWFKQQNIEPYPYTFDKKNNASEIIKNFSKLENKKVSVAGRINNLRRHGKIGFIDLEDSSGKIQLFIAINDVGEKQYNIFKHLDRGDFIGIKGTVFKTKAGEKSIKVKHLALLSKCLEPLPSNWYGLKDIEVRYRRRSLDLIMNPEVKKVFETRTKIINLIREFFNKKGFLEVTTPTLQPIYGGAAARPFKTFMNDLKMDVYLRTSNELYLKRLIVGGFEKIYEFAIDFRNEAIDTKHNPEFMQIEAYQAYTDYNNMMDLFEELMKFLVKQVLGKTRFKYQGQEIDFGKWERITMVDALKKYAKINVKNKSLKELKLLAKKNKVQIPAKATEGEIINELFENLVDSKIIKPTILMDHPKETTPLCKLKRGDPRFVERFEPYCCGMEIGNAYSELNDPELQRELLEQQVSQRKNPDEPWTEALDEDYLKSLNLGMPPTGGLGIGIARLVMLFTDSPSIRDVILFPFMKPEK